MSKTKVFDLLIVYTQRLADSASGSNQVTSPFPKGSSSESYNVVYGYFLKTCDKAGLTAAFTTSKDIVGPGRTRSYWLFANNVWIKVNRAASSKLIFDKFSPVNRQIKAHRDLLFSSAQVKPFNQPRLFELFFDKHKAYKKLAKFSIPTVAIEAKTEESLFRACQSLKRIIARHPRKQDFSEDLIVKDRFGAGGLNVFKINSQRPDKVLKAIRKCARKSFIVQPFVKFDRGFSYLNSPVSADIRLIYLGGRIVQAYLRLAKTGDFRCNEHQGGRLLYIAKKEVPAAVTNLSRQIAKLLKQKRSLYALDFIVSNNGHVYLLEGNTGPGLDWNLSLKENELEAKKLIRVIVKELAKRVAQSTPKPKIKPILPLVGDYLEPAMLPVVV